MICRATGNDTLAGGAGNDRYVFAKGDGADVITESDNTAGNTDFLLFGNGITEDQLWFRHVGSALEVSVIGTTDKVTINSWYSGSADHLEKFKLTDGSMLLDSQVEALVSAMAAFAPPALDETTLSAAQQTALAPVLAANWS